MKTYTIDSESDAYHAIQDEADRLAKELTGYSFIDPSPHAPGQKRANRKRRASKPPHKNVAKKQPC